MRAASLVLALALLVPAIASAKPHELVGKWRAVAAEQAGKRVPLPAGMAVSMELRERGVFVGVLEAQGKVERQEGTWQVEGDRLTTVTRGARETLKYQLLGRELRLTAPDGQVIFWSRT